MKLIYRKTNIIGLINTLVMQHTTANPVVRITHIGFYIVPNTTTTVRFNSLVLTDSELKRFDNHHPITAWQQILHLLFDNHHITFVKYLSSLAISADKTHRNNSIIDVPFILKNNYGFLEL
jgi:hypothetical protein